MQANGKLPINKIFKNTRVACSLMSVNINFQSGCGSDLESHTRHKSFQDKSMKNDDTFISNDTNNRGYIYL